MKRSWLPLVGPAMILLGLLVLAASYRVNLRTPGQAWTDAEQQSFHAAALAYHQIAHAPRPSARGKSVAALTEGDLRTARERFELERRRLQAVREAGRRTKSALWWGGLGLCVAGLGWTTAARSN